MPTDIKARIRAEIDDDAVVAFAKDLCRIPSFTTEETPVARHLAEVFTRAGFQVDLQEVDPGRFQTIARLPGTGGGRSLMFNGHIDIDPLAAGWRRDPFDPQVEGDRFFAAGIYNMKGGDTAMCMAALAAKRAGVALSGDVVVACVVGELQAGVGTVHMLKQGIRADMAIVPEPYTTDNVITKHTGVMQLAVHVRGRTAHISRKGEGVNAIVKTARLARALHATPFRFEPDPELPDLPLISVGSVRGGRGEGWEPRGANFVPDRAALFLDVRFNQSMTPESVVADIRAVCEREKAADPALDYVIEYPLRADYGLATMTMLPLSTDRDHAIVRTVVANAEEITGRTPTVGAVRPYSYAGNDTSHLYGAGIPCLLYGPGGGFVDDAPDRWTSVRQILDCTRIFAGAIADVCA